MTILKHLNVSGTTAVPQILRFTLHFLEMALAMVLGMVALGAINGLFLVPAGFLYLTPKYLEVHVLAMASCMAAPMVAWMHVRGHGWEPSAEMAGAMFVPALCAITLCAVGVLPRAAMLPLAHNLMWIAMLGVMLARWRHYAGAMHEMHHAPVPAPDTSRVNA